MSDLEARQLERILRRDGGLSGFVFLALEDLDAATLFRVREASERLLLELSRGKAENVEPVEELQDRIAEVPLRVTLEGFARFEFSDHFGERCSLEESSIATEDAVWLGIDEPLVRVLAPGGASVGTDLEYPNEAPGWAHAKIRVSGGDVLHIGRMHLTQDRLRVLLPLLQSFVDTGRLVGAPDPDDERARMIRTLPDGRILRHGDDCSHCNGTGSVIERDCMSFQCPVCLGETETDLTDPGFMGRFDEFYQEAPNA